MASFIGQPTFPVDFLRPTRAWFDQVGNGLDGGVNGEGDSATTEFSGGGKVTATYERMVLQGPDERHEVINWLGARLNGGFRYINVPIVNDKIGAFPVIAGAIRPIVSGIPHSDGSFFSDGAGYSQATVWGELTEDAALNAGIIKVRVYNAARKMFRWSDWFSIYHSVKGWRAYRSWELIGQTNETAPISTIAVSPPLRQQTPAGTRIELARPMCVMKLKRGETIPWDYEGYYQSRPTVNFIEV